MTIKEVINIYLKEKEMQEEEQKASPEELDDEFWSIWEDEELNEEETEEGLEDEPVYDCTEVLNFVTEDVPAVYRAETDYGSTYIITKADEKLKRMLVDAGFEVAYLAHTAVNTLYISKNAEESDTLVLVEKPLDGKTVYVIPVSGIVPAGMGTGSEDAFLGVKVLVKAYPITFENPIIGFKVLRQNRCCKGNYYPPYKWTEYEGETQLYYAGIHFAISEDVAAGWYRHPSPTDFVVRCQAGPETIIGRNGVAVTNRIYLFE